jgi:hypothetical protein
LTGTIYGILYKREKGKVGGGREEKKGKERKRKAKARLRTSFNTMFTSF